MCARCARKTRPKTGCREGEDALGWESLGRATGPRPISRAITLTINADPGKGKEEKRGIFYITGTQTGPRFKAERQSLRGRGDKKQHEENRCPPGTTGMKNLQSMLLLLAAKTDTPDGASRMPLGRDTNAHKHKKLAGRLICLVESGRHVAQALERTLENFGSDAFFVLPLSGRFLPAVRA